MKTVTGGAVKNRKNRPAGGWNQSRSATDGQPRNPNPRRASGRYSHPRRCHRAMSRKRMTTYLLSDSSSIRSGKTAAPVTDGSPSTPLGANRRASFRDRRHRCALRRTTRLSGGPLGCYESRTAYFRPRSDAEPDTATEPAKRDVPPRTSVRSVVLPASRVPIPTPAVTATAPANPKSSVRPIAWVCTVPCHPPVPRARTSSSWLKSQRVRGYRNFRP